MGYILSIDQGTTGTTSVLIKDDTFEFVGKVNQEFPQIFPKPSWVEHNLKDIWNSTTSTIKEVLKKYNVQANEISSIGITNQRETTCAFSNDGTPLANAIVWQDRRTGDYCEELRSQGKEDSIKQTTGLPIDAYFSATKMRWLLNENPDVKKAASENNLKFGNIDTFLLYKLSGNKSFATESSNASRTLLMSLESGDWSSELLDLFGISKNLLPEIKDSFCHFGTTLGLDVLPDGIPITGILGDQQAALFGQAGFEEGDIKCTYGTGAFMLLNTGKTIKRSQNGLLSTVAYQQDGNRVYALEGSSYIAGAAVQWLRDNLKLFPNSPDIEELAKSVKDLDSMKNILFLPFFTGIGSPYWKSDATGAIIGLTRDTGIPQISRACLEGITYSINDLLSAMKEDTGLNISEMKVDGGAVANNLLMEIQSSISNCEIIRPVVIETTAYGAALASAIGKGTINFSDIKKLWKEDKTFKVDSSNTDYYSKKYNDWSQAIKRMFL
ncbi:MAG: glycerol kinase GlpK [Bacteriovoracaceae bacterium]|nr:glycerol kinase GlpK [Bacteriovoracaceae bacterium]